MGFAKDKLEFLGVMKDEGVSPDDAHTILRLAEVCQKFAVNYCNRAVSETEIQENDAAERDIRAICAKYGIRPLFSGDPRGAVVKLLLKSGRWNSWGGAECGFCVPTKEF